MDTIATIIYSNSMIFIGLVVVLLISRHNPMFHKSQNKLFEWITFSFLLVIIAISADFYLSQTSGATHYLWRRMTSFINFAAAPFPSIGLYLIFSGGKPKPIFLCPFIFNLVVCSFSIFYPIVFFIDIANNYIRGPLFVIPFLVCTLYMGFLLHQTICSTRRTRRKELYFLIFSWFLLMGGLILEIVFYYHFITWMAAGLCVILYYLLLNVNNSGIDALTGIFNRFAYTLELNRMRGNYACVVALIDINDFKPINDTYGHDKGDEFLVTFSRILEEGLPKSASLYRIGGDEYAVLSRRLVMEDLHGYLHQTQETMEQYGMYFSYGIAPYSPENSIDHAIMEADQKMYYYKALYKAQRMKEKQEGISHRVYTPPQ